MYARIQSNMHRQYKALEVLEMLLSEEFDALRARDTDTVTNLEFSIHELLRQIAVERMDLKNSMQGTTVLEYAGIISDEDNSQEIKRLYALIDGLEQRCSRQASHNAELSLALMDQSQAMLVFLHNQIAPPVSNTYGSRGRVKQERPSAALYSGRL